MSGFFCDKLYKNARSWFKWRECELSDLAEGKPKTLSHKIANVRVLIGVLLITLLIVFASYPLIQSVLTRTGEQVAEDTNPPIPVITSKSGLHSSLGFSVSFTVYNKGGLGTIEVGAFACYETLSHSSFKQSALIYLNSNESRHIRFTFAEIITVPCGNTHAILWSAWARVP